MWCLVLVRRGTGVGLVWVWAADDQKHGCLSGTINEWRREEAFDEELGVINPGEDPIEEAGDVSDV